MEPDTPFDCEHIHLISGLCFQDVVNSKLKDSMGFKASSDYYYFSTEVVRPSSELSAHVSMFSVASGSVINYGKVLYGEEEFTFENFRNGEAMPLVGRYSISHSGDEVTLHKNSTDLQIWATKVDFKPNIHENFNEHVANKFEFDFTNLLLDRHIDIFGRDQSEVVN
jgi:hypothetical protein